MTPRSSVALNAPRACRIGVHPTTLLMDLRLYPLLALVLLSAAPLSTPTKQAPLKVFILAGQSNMVGAGEVKANLDRNGGQGSLEHLVKSTAKSKRYSHLVDGDCYGCAGPYSRCAVRGTPHSRRHSRPNRRPTCVKRCVVTIQRWSRLSMRTSHSMLRCCESSRRCRRSVVQTDQRYRSSRNY